MGIENINQVPSDSENESSKTEEEVPSSRPEEPVYMLGIENKSIRDYQHLINLQEKSLQDFYNAPNKSRLKPEEEFKITNDIKERIKVLKLKALEEVDHLIDVENKTLESLHSFVKDEKTEELIRQHEAKKAEHEQLRSHFS